MSILTQLRVSALASADGIRGSFDARILATSIFLALAFEEKVFVTSNMRAREMDCKKLMTSCGISNGAASAYSKLAVAFGSRIIEFYGRQSNPTKGDFWEHWQAANSGKAKETLVINFVTVFCSDNSISSIGTLMDTWNIPYSGNETERRYQLASLSKNSEPAKRLKTQDAILARQKVLSALLKLPEEDQVWVVKSHRLLRPKPSRPN